MMSLEHSAVQDVTIMSDGGIDRDEMIPILKSIIVTRSRDGATIDEIIGDYKEHTGDNLLSEFRDRDSIAEALRQIPGVWSSFSQPDGPFLWFCYTPNSQHIADMIKKQKSPRNNRKYYQQVPKYQAPKYQFPPRTPLYNFAANATTLDDGTTSTAPSGNQDKFFADNINFIPKRNAWNRTQYRSSAGSHPYLPPPQQQRRQQQVKPMAQQRYYSNAVDTGSSFCGYQMIGDDFFLSLARWELGFSFDPGHTIQKSGLCISGLTIAEAADRVMKATYINDRVIVNVGAVDLMHGADFVDMQADLFQLMKNLENRGAQVILTTVSPLANFAHIPDMKDRLNRFNKLIRRYHWQYIDMWRCFVNERANTLYECFQPGPRTVTGSNQPHVLWNKLGRQRVIKFLKTELAALI